MKSAVADLPRRCNGHAVQVLRPALRFPRKRFNPTVAHVPGAPSPYASKVAQSDLVVWKLDCLGRKFAHSKAPVRLGQVAMASRDTSLARY